VTDDPLSAELIAMLDATRDAERELFGALDREARDAPLRPGDWSPRDHQAHLTAWKGRQADRLAAARDGRELPGIDEGETDAVNEVLRAARADWSWEAIDAEADEVSARLVAEIRATDPTLIRGSTRLLNGAYDNGALHALVHLGWLSAAGIGIDDARLRTFAASVERMVAAGSLPPGERGIALYNLACMHATSGDLPAARRLLGDAFRLQPDLVAFAPKDPDLAALHEELDRISAQ
jgi:DinB superfamily